ncbi:DUF389 domain-containing protein [Myroides sp. JBRI-B21084]|uniref:DUF389 domain-containing protein n=1 Tax=Myroides sp. JBRI-B21084 TaxID=3119977 RepID=UPI0026E47A6A|nr:DUF389 domain-containing protein [Paenimyroides cloacae]WKW45656.1 DUF389 domain-containing protein [Paenimyroides cloacae]
MGNKLIEFINLHTGEEDKQKVLENVAANISFRGSNLWILACAIIIASVGLNVNSTAVIIGAMLISPLMGPIVGAGFALGTYDFVLLRKSIKNLLIATAVSLAVSSFYFYLSPFKDVQSEILSRTSPNIYDVLIAFFGGLVGVIAITRVEKGNPIPGVAIATALMPPLCTAGYGLATFNFSYFIGAFYLYSINCFFICIATFLVIKYLKYPISATIDQKNEKRIRYGITSLLFILIIPSFYLAFNLYQEKKYTKTVEAFIDNEFNDRGFTVIFKKINYNSSPKTIELAFLNKILNKNDIYSYKKMLNEKGITNTDLIIRQDDANLKDEILKEVNKQNSSVTEKDITISNLRKELNKYKTNEPGLVKEINILFPELNDVSLGKIEKNIATDSAHIEWIIIYKLNNPLIKPDVARIKNWLNKRLNVKNTILVQNNEE